MRLPLTCLLLTGWLSVHAEPASPIPYVATRHDTVRDLLWLAEVGTNDVVYDLGSGDGRVVIAAVRDFGARRAVGIEIDPRLVDESRAKAAQLGLSDRVQFIQGDLFTNDFSPASVVVLYLGHRANLDLRAKLFRALKPGARVVSHQFGMGEWTADKTLDVRSPYLGMHSQAYNEFSANPEVPDFGSMDSGPGHDVLSEWVIPAPVAGVWRGDQLRVTLHQRLSKLNGEFQFNGATAIEGPVTADLWGRHVRFSCGPAGSASQLWFEGQADHDTLTGTLWISEKQSTRQVEWVGRREKSDFAGIWEWAGPSDSPAQFKIQRRDQGLFALYTDQGPAIEIKDLYDFGGGFYFTLLLGKLPDGSRRVGDHDGWLVGEAVAQPGGILGTIAFYPYRHRFEFGLPAEKPKPGEGPHAWQPKTIAP
jgi:SAM-dependent methyltransferase